MRGNPWTRIMLVAFAVVLMGLPVWRLTHAVGPPEPAARQEASAAKTFTVTATFAHAPESFALTNLGQSILSGAGPTVEFTAPWQISLPKEGTDLLLKVKWPADTPRTAVEIKIGSSGDVLSDRTFWGTGTLTELLTVLPTKP